MIRVIITAPAVSGRFSYMVPTEGTRLVDPMKGLSGAPLLDACYRLKKMNAAPDEAQIGLYDNAQMNELQFRLRTTVGYGAGMVVRETQTEGPRFVKRGPPLSPEGIVARAASRRAKDALKSSEGTQVAPDTENDEIDYGVEPTAATPAISEEAPPPPRTPPKFPDDTGPVPKARATPGTTHHKRKPGVSGARRGRR